METCRDASAWMQAPGVNLVFPDHCMIRSVHFFISSDFVFSRNTIPLRPSVFTIASSSWIMPNVSFCKSLSQWMCLHFRFTIRITSGFRWRPQTPVSPARFPNTTPIRHQWKDMIAEIGWRFALLREVSSLWKSTEYHRIAKIVL